MLWELQYNDYNSTPVGSLVPRRSGGGGKRTPGTHCWRMRLIKAYKPRGFERVTCQQSRRVRDDVCAGQHACHIKYATVLKQSTLLSAWHGN